MFGWPPLVWGIISAGVGADVVFLFYRRQRRTRCEERLRARRDFDQRYGSGKG